jgi:hypothetical protein
MKKTACCGNCAFFRQRSFLNRVVQAWSNFWASEKYTKIKGDCQAFYASSESLTVAEEEMPCGLWKPSKRSWRDFFRRFPEMKKKWQFILKHSKKELRAA